MTISKTAAYEVMSWPVDRWAAQVAMRTAPLAMNPYRRLSPQGASDMAKQRTHPDAITWSQLSVIAILLVAAIGGGFAWLHSDMTTLNATVRTMAQDIGVVRVEAARTNEQLKILIEEVRKSPAR